MSNNVDTVKDYENISLRLYKDSDTGELYIEIELRGRVKDYAKTKGRVYLSDEKLIYKIEVVAGAIAEHQNEQVGETHDPDKCAKAARKAYFELKKQLDNKNMQILPEVENIG